MAAIVVDLSSDTVTRPTREMRRFMCDAEVGDEQKLEDPTVTLLQELVADLLGKEAALFLPSGTMCNEIAMRVHCRPGDEMLAHRTAHPIHFEGGGPAALAGVNVSALDGPRGQYDAEAVATAIRPESRYMPRSRLLWVEQTSNLGGGSVWPLARIAAGSANSSWKSARMRRMRPASMRSPFHSAFRIALDSASRPICQAQRASSIFLSGVTLVLIFRK